MCVRWLATVRSPRKSAAATSRFVRPSATRAATRCSAAVSPLLARAPSDAPELVLAPSRPRWLRRAARSRRARPGARRGRRAFCRSRLRTMPSARRARARPYGIADRLVLRDRLLEERCGPSRAIPRRRSTQAAAARRVREHPLAAEPSRVGLPDVEESRPRRRRARGSSSASTWSRAPPADARLAPPERRCLLVRLAEPLEALGHVSTPERGEPEHRQVLRRVERELLLRKLEGSLRMLARERRAARGGRRRPRSADDPGAPRARTGSRCRAPAPPGRPRAPSGRPRTRATRDPRARGHSAARLARATPRARARTTRGPRLSSTTARSVFTTASVASCTSCAPPTAVAKSCGRAGKRRRLRVADHPAEDRLRPPGRAPEGRRRRARRRARSATRACSSART